MNEKTLHALLDTITPLVENSPYSRTMLYGESGTGKTVLACDYGEDVILVDSATGFVSLLNHPEVEKKVRRMEYRNIIQLEALVDAIIEGELTCDTVVLDEFSSMAVADLDVVLAARSAKDSDKDPNVPTQPDFFSNTERIRRIGTKLLRLPCSVVMVAHVRYDEDKKTGRLYTRPAFSPKTRQTLVQHCHIVGHLTVNEVSSDNTGVTYSRKLQVHPTRNITAKTRVGGLPAVVENPNLNTIYKNWHDRIIKGKVEAETTEPEPDAPVVDDSSAGDSEPVEVEDTITVGE